MVCRGLLQLAQKGLLIFPRFCRQPEVSSMCKFRRDGSFPYFDNRSGSGFRLCQTRRPHKEHNIATAAPSGQVKRGLGQ